MTLVDCVDSMILLSRIYDFVILVVMIDLRSYRWSSHRIQDYDFNNLFLAENTAEEAPTVNVLLNKNNTNSIQEETKREACPRRAAELN